MLSSATSIRQDGMGHEATTLCIDFIKIVQEAEEMDIDGDPFFRLGGVGVDGLDIFEGNNNKSYSRGTRWTSKQPANHLLGLA